ncbi:MAG: 3-phosphoglycerate dehydrogenase [Clostridiales Family XIII bacterium]|nr:3-phosphoglycerate dehydrogenase [Clostridiales Family XIII bacterium]
MKLFSDDYSFSDELKKADAVILRSFNLHKASFPNSLLAIARAGAGTNNIPIERASEKGIVVFNTPGANANAVKELTLASLFMASRNLYDAINWAKKLKGDDIPEIVEQNKSNFSGNEILGKNLGVVGLGSIGVAVANAAEKLGMGVYGFDPYISVESAHSLSPTIKIFSDLKDLILHSDFITLHIPSITKTENMIDKKALKEMDKNTVLINFSREKIVDKKALLKALDAKSIKLYISDFIDKDLLKRKNVMPFPHLGASTLESEENCAIMAAKEIIDFLENGNIMNSINFPNIKAGHITTATRVTMIHENIAGVFNKLTSLFAGLNANISNMISKSKGRFAYTVMDVDIRVSKKTVLETFNFPGIIRVRVLHK